MTTTWYMSTKPYVAVIFGRGLWKTVGWLDFVMVKIRNYFWTDTDCLFHRILFHQNVYFTLMLWQRSFIFWGTKFPRRWSFFVTALIWDLSTKFPRSNIRANPLDPAGRFRPPEFLLCLQPCRQIDAQVRPTTCNSALDAEHYTTATYFPCERASTVQ